MYQRALRGRQYIAVKGFVMGKNRQKCQKFSFLDRFLKLIELVDQYLMHVNFSKFSNFHQFFRFFSFLKKSNFSIVSPLSMSDFDLVPIIPGTGF